MTRVLYLLIYVLGVVAQVGVASEDNNRHQTLDKAFNVYAEAQAAKQRELRMEKFKRAQHLFTSVASNTDVNAALWTNIGTAALQAENLGAAILAFRRALLAQPDYAQAKQNLKHARTLLPSSVPTPSSESVLDSFFFWHKAMTIRQRAGVGALFFVLASIGFASAIRWRSGLLRSLSIFPLLIWGVLLVTIVIQLKNDEELQGVIIIDDTIARAADSVNAPMRFSQGLPAGTEVEILDIRDRWAKISLSNGRDAWVAKSSFELVARRAL